MDNDPIKTADITLRMVQNRVKGLSQHLDKLYEKGKKDGWPKEVMDYIMWFEHEVCRLPAYIDQDVMTIRKGLNVVRAKLTVDNPENHT